VDRDGSLWSLLLRPTLLRYHDGEFTDMKFWTSEHQQRLHWGAQHLLPSKNLHEIGENGWEVRHVHADSRFADNK
jgi:hypothetical protein